MRDPARRPAGHSRRDRGRRLKLNDPRLLAFALPLILEAVGRRDAFHALFGPTGVQAGWWELGELLWWAGWAITLFGVVPAWLVRGRLAEHGLRLPRHVGLYGLLYLGMLPALVYYSHDPRFQASYPFFHHARTDPALLPVWWLAYAVMFVALEFFFRGYLIFALTPRWGAWALLISAFPYFLSHCHKPLPEMLGSFPAGLALGFLAWRTGSIAGGVMVHLSVAFTMDALVLLS